MSRDYCSTTLSRLWCPIHGGAWIVEGIVIYKDYGHQYQCKAWTSKCAKPDCQYLAGKPVDEAVVQEFFSVLQLAEIDALLCVDARQMEHQRELEQHLEQEGKRLDYAAKRAERQYYNVDPENRLIASTLETRWESALTELEQSKARLAELRARSPKPVPIPAELRDAFADADGVEVYGFIEDGTAKDHVIAKS
jgi:hypothetical protein